MLIAVGEVIKKTLLIAALSIVFVFSFLACSSSGSSKQKSSKEVWVLIKADKLTDGIEYSNHEFDENGNLVHVTEKEGNATTQVTNEHNDKGILQKKTEEHTYLKKTTTDVTTYDEYGNRVMLREERRNLVLENTNEYDDGGRLIKATAVNTTVNGYPTILEYKYDESSLSPDFTEASKKCIFELTYEYDSHGNVVRDTIKQIKGGSSIWTEAFTYEPKVIVVTAA